LNKLFVIIKREYLLRVKTKAFLIGTFLLPVFIIGISFLPALLMRTNLGEQKKLVVIDETHQLFEPLSTTFADMKNNKGEPRYLVTQIQTGNNREETLNSLNQQVSSGALDAYLILPPDIFQQNQFELYGKNLSNFEFIQAVERTVSGVVRNIRLNESGMDVGLVEKLNHWVGAKTFQVGETGSRAQRAEASFILNLLMGMMIYMMLLMYGQFVMRAIVEDKNSRVIEVIISSVKPMQYMAGKVIGIGATGLTQFLIWVITALLVSLYGLSMVQMFAPDVSQLVLPQISPWVYAAFVFYFLFGYFLYATLSAAIGSMVNSDSEAQSYQWIIMMPIILSFLLMFSITNSPNSLLATILSLFPLFTPILMFSRILSHAAPLWQVLLSFALMILSLWGSLWLCGRIFRIGILMYGKKPTLPEVAKWIKYS
jgi:ABC-2 type transport system permease protein